MKIKVGSDPEFSCRSKATKQFVSSPNVIVFTKDKPYKGSSVKLFSDNANLEINVIPGATAKEFTDNVRAAIKETVSVVGDGHIIEAVAAVDYPEAELDNDYCRQFGCEPDFNAWTLEENVIADGAAASTLRTNGGHIHVDLTQIPELNTPMGRVEVIRAMDAIVGLASLELDDDPASVRRRTLYGAAGAHRPKPYGVEYRAISNFYYRSPQLVDWAFNMTNLAVRMAADKSLEKVTGWEEIPHTITTGNVERGRELFAKVTDIYPVADIMQESVRALKSSKMPADIVDAWLGK